MLHPCTWSFPCWLVKHMSWMWASWVSLRTAAVSRGLLMIARKTESTEADDTHAARCVCPHGWAHSAQPMRGKGGFVVSEQVLEAASQRCRVTWIRESPHAPCPPREKRKISRCHTLLHFLFVSIPLRFISYSWCSTEVWFRWCLAQSLDLLYYPAFTVFLFSLLFSTACLTLWFDK